MEDELLQSNFLIELNSVEKTNLFKISPIGEAIGVDKRVFTIDGQTVIKNTQNRVIDIVLNKNHYESEAFGWFDINSLELKDDGIYAKLELNNLGQIAVSNKHFRYLSPEFRVNPVTREVHSIIGVGLVNAPNLLNKAINKQEKEENMPREDELQKELNSANAKAMSFEKELNKVNSELKSLQEENKTLKETNKLNLIDNAIASGELLPAQKEFALSLEANSLAGFLASVKETNKTLTQSLNKETSVNKDDNKEDNNSKIVKDMGWE